ncbi:hypothetical protein [Labrys neptuniae]
MANSPSADDLRKELEKQIADLKKEIGGLSKSLSQLGSNAYESTKTAADGLLDQAKGKARGAARQARGQAELVSDTMKENPGAFTAVLSSAGFVGFLLGALAVGALLNSSRR